MTAQVAGVLRLRLMMVPGPGLAKRDPRAVACPPCHCLQVACPPARSTRCSQHPPSCAQLVATAWALVPGCLYSNLAIQLATAMPAAALCPQECAGRTLVAFVACSLGFLRHLQCPGPVSCRGLEVAVSSVPPPSVHLRPGTQMTSLAALCSPKQGWAFGFVSQGPRGHSCGTDAEPSLELGYLSGCP